VTVVKEELLQHPPERLGKRIHVALPIRVTYWDSDNKPCLEMACTYDISPHGARVTGLRCMKATGEIIAIERGRNKAFCRVVWIGEPDSELRGQVGLQSVESDRTIWDTELREMDEVYDVIQRGSGYRPSATPDKRNRRRQPRFELQGLAELLKRESKGRHQEATLKNLSEMGCLIATREALLPGTDLKLVLNVANYDLSVKGQVRHAALDMGLGIEFREIRKGDRQMLKFLLRKMAEQETEQQEKDTQEKDKPAARAAAVSL
jgi:hypothetical protein